VRLRSCGENPLVWFLTTTTLLVLSLASQRLRMPAADQPYRRGSAR
jgi:hypothetical protein